MDFNLILAGWQLMFRLQASDFTGVKRVSRKLGTQAGKQAQGTRPVFFAHVGNG
jgi:hypothetical protein